MLMLLRLLGNEENDHVIKWMFQLSSIILFTFVGGEVYVATRGGRIFGTKLMDYDQIDQNYEDILEFQVN